MKTRFKKNDTGNHLKMYSKYSGIAIQMLVIILFGVFGGVKIDHWINWELPIFTVLLSVLAVFLAIYIVTKDLIKRK